MRRLAVLIGLISGCVALHAQTVLVLPFFNQSNSSNLDWIGESISEAVRESLASEDVLALQREDRLEAFRRLLLRPNARLTHASIIKAGETLDATDVIYGSYDFTPASPPPPGAGMHGTLRIAAWIVNVKRYRRGPEMSESGPLDELAVLEARLSWQALHAVAPKQAPSEDEFVRARPRVRLDALENYIRGLLAPDVEQQRSFFMQAARLDAGYSPPCYQLGKSYWQKKDYRTAAGWLARVNRPDSHYLEAQFFLGLCDYHLGDYANAAKCFETVASSVPLNEVYNDLGVAQLHTDPAAAIDSLRKALDGDRTDPDYHFNLGYALWKAGQYPAAAERFRAVLERSPQDSAAAAALAHVEKGEPPRPGSESLERLKTNYEETAYRQLKAELESKKTQ